MKHFLSFHTIFVLDENIKWLEEFIKYYIHIGFDHFYLYDNEGTTGGDGTSKKNKYGFPIEVNNTQENNMMFQNILAKYQDKITYLKWQPRSKEGNVIYGQDEGVKHFMQNYGAQTEWVALMDFDEFLFSPKNINIPDYLYNLQSNISCVKIVQKKFEDRFLTDNNDFSITRNFKCINKEIGVEWSPKNIVRCNDFLGIDSIHNIAVKNEVFIEDSSVLRFNHYNVNDKLLDWMTNLYSSPTKFQLDGIDDGMKRYSLLFDSNIEPFSSYTFNLNDNFYWRYLIIAFLFIFLILLQFYNSKPNISMTQIYYKPLSMFFKPK